MIVNIFFDDEEFADIVTVPQSIENIEDAQSKFFEWMFDKENNHKYWIIINGEKMGCRYGTEAFIEWINNTILKDEYHKAKILEKNTTRYNILEEKLYF